MLGAKRALKNGDDRSFASFVETAKSKLYYISTIKAGIELAEKGYTVQGVK